MLSIRILVVHLVTKMIFYYIELDFCIVKYSIKGWKLWWVTFTYVRIDVFKENVLGIICNYMLDNV